jgi:YfiH family protein
MERIDINGVAFYRFEKIAGEPSLEHGLFTRLGGVSRPPCATLNLGHTVGDDLSAVAVNHERALGVLSWQREDVATCYQVHGARVAVVGLDDRSKVQPETDALVTNTPGVGLMMRFADCVPVLFFDRQRRVIGIAHAGWRGVAAGVVQATVATMLEAFGCQSQDVWAGIGPSIGPCCYEVGQEVVERVSMAVQGPAPFWYEDGRVRLDLWAAVRSQLDQAGVGQVEAAQLCTACRTDEWFSHRAERGKTGRHGVVIGLRASSRVP